jgi:hypothetical protein
LHQGALGYEPSYGESVTLFSLGDCNKRNFIASIDTNGAQTCP